jgi:DNA polymerase-4
MRAARRTGRTVVVRLRFDDFSRATRSRTLAHATAHTATVLDVVRTLLRDARPLVIDRGLTLVGVAVSNLEGTDAVQLPLPFERRSTAPLDEALDHLRERFGSSSVRRAATLRYGDGLAVPMLPD